eukprot:12897864-Ditylum_brightwellii.AAC.1
MRLLTTRCVRPRRVATTMVKNCSCPLASIQPTDARTLKVPMMSFMLQRLAGVELCVSISQDCRLWVAGIELAAHCITCALNQAYPLQS